MVRNMISFPTKIEDVKGGQIRAGGTDLQELRHKKISEGDLVDLRDLLGVSTIEAYQGGYRIGAKVSVASLSLEKAIQTGYPGLAQAAGGLATPQIRAIATLGGNLLQRSRCWYFRNPEAKCLKKGGSSCLARAGDHLFHACFDTGPCVAVHPSTLGMALLAYEATIETGDAKTLTIEALYGDGKDPTRENQLPTGAFLRSVVLPPPLAGESAWYLRAISRARSEWPLVEVLVRLVVQGGSIQFARVVAGGIANVPMRFPEVEKRLEKNPATEETFREAAKLSTKNASPLPMTKYKVPMLSASIEDALTKAAGGVP